MIKFFKDMKIKNQMVFTLALMGMLCMVLGAVGFFSMLHYNELASKMENASARAIIGESLNATVLAVVMDSRGIYMSSTQEEVEKYGKPLLKNLEKIQGQMKDWQALLPEPRKAELDEVSQKVTEFAQYRAEIVRLAREVSIADGRAWGDNDKNRDNRKKLNDLVVTQAKQNAEEIQHSLEDMKNFFVQQRTILIVLGACLMPLVILFTLLISMKLMVNPIRNMTQTMNKLASGNLTVDIPGLGNKNEIGDMATAVEVFRKGLIEADKFSEADKVQQRAKEARIHAMDKLINDFDMQIKDSLSSINSSSTELEATAQSLTEMAEQSSVTATSVAAASEEATTNVLAVAQASEKMSSSIQDIIREVNQSRNAIDQAANEAQETSVVAQGLIEATKKIDDVVGIIQDIAAQTNLLALNATIEAARAGEMGKGFAVVANEVKNLATQTANSTELIAEQVGAVQNVSTQVVTAITRICETIRQINEMSEAVTHTMSAQGAVTTEISANINEAAEGTRDVTANINGVSRSAVETGNAASQLLIAASDIATQSTNLRDQVGTFLKGIKQL